jgi:hypothetical protein
MPLLCPGGTQAASKPTTQSAIHAKSLIIGELVVISALELLFLPKKRRECLKAYHTDLQ